MGSVKNTGREYENFVRTLQQALLDAEAFAGQENVQIQTNKKLIDRCGVTREFDLYWEYRFGGLTYKTVIECKDYNSKIPLEKIDALIGKTADLPDLRAVFATKKGYQSGAIEKAAHNKIELLVVRKQQPSDWVDKDGNHYLKEIHIRTKALVAAHITEFKPLIDAKWAEENTDLDISQPPTIGALSNQIVINDKDSGTTYSLYELQAKLAQTENPQYGSHSMSKRFKDATIQGPGFDYQIKGYDISYNLPRPLEMESIIDFSDELLGVIEYLQQGNKKAVFRDGHHRDEQF